MYYSIANHFAIEAKLNIGTDYTCVEQKDRHETTVIREVQPIPREDFSNTKRHSATGRREAGT